MRYLSILFFFFLISSLFAQNDSFYQDISESIVYLRHEVYIDSKGISDVHLIEQIESEWDIDVIDTFVTLKSGSGFLISENGFAITNRHVIQNLEDSIGGYVEWFVREFCMDFSEDDRWLVRSNLYSAIIITNQKLAAFIGEEKYDVLIHQVANDNEPDLALIQLLSEDEFIPLRLASSQVSMQSLVGEEVFSLGFPLGSTIDDFFSERAVTMNSGNISAYRNEELGIQHSADISPGNSGGPLVDGGGTVLGVNTAHFEEGNSLYYSIDAHRVTTFLNQRGYENIVRRNARLSGGASSSNTFPLNALGEFESSADLVIMAAPGSDIYVNNEYVGKAPMYYSIEDSIIVLRVENEKGTFEVPVRRLSSLSGATELVPIIEQELNAVVSFNCEDVGNVEVYGDGQYMGETPLTIELVEGVYEFSFISDNRFIENIEAELIRGDHNTYNLQGIEGAPLNISGLDPDVYSGEQDDIIHGLLHSITAQKLVFRSIEYEMELEFAPDDSIVLPVGDWKLSVYGNPMYEGISLPVTIPMENNVLNFEELVILGDVNITGLFSDSQIFINGELFEDEDTFSLPIGMNEVFIWNPGRTHFGSNLNVNVKGIQVNNYTEMSHGRRALIWNMTSAALVGGGLAVGLWDSDSYALSNSNNYDEYVEQKEKIATISSGLMIGGFMAVIPAMIQYVKQRRSREVYDEYMERNARGE